MNNYHKANQLKLTLIDTVEYTIPAGAAGWIDTDCHVALGTDTRRIYLVNILTAGASSAVGARPHGSATSPAFSGNNTTHCEVNVDTSGHIDFYRDAAVQNKYQVFGYLEMS